MIRCLGEGLLLCVLRGSCIKGLTVTAVGHNRVMHSMENAGITGENFVVATNLRFIIECEHQNVLTSNLYGCVKEKWDREGRAM